MKTLSKPAALLIATLMYACGGGTTSENAASSETAQTEVVESTPATAPVETVQKEEISAADSQELTGEDKISNSDCLSCHMVEQKMIGPAYVDVAAEYENNEANVTMLAQKIIKGGVGAWGEVPMPPHADLSEEDAKDMVRYILSLSVH